MKDFLLLPKKIKKLNKNKRWLLLCLIVIYFALIIVNVFIKKEIKKEKILPFNSSVKLSSYPLLNSVLGADVSSDLGSKTSPNISAEAAMVMDDQSNVILFSKNPGLRFSMASTTKIMTALTALDYFKLNDILTVKSEEVEGTVVGFKKDEKFFFEDLLYAMLLPSGNDAALAIAQNFLGEEKEFIKKMNENAKQFNLINTHYQDVAGLADEGDYTTVTDLARLASIAVKNQIFSRIVATESKLITDVTGVKKYKLLNLNKLLGTNGVNGIKTGFTDEAGGVLVTSRIKNGRKLIIVVMKSSDRFLDTQELLNFVSDVTYLRLN